MKRFDFIFIISVVLLVLGYYSVKLNKPNKPNHKERASHQYTKPLKPGKIIQKNVEDTPDYYYEEAIQHYQAVNQHIQTTIQNYKHKSKEYSALLLSKKTAFEDYKNQITYTQSDLQELENTVKFTHEVTLLDLQKEIWLAELFIQSIKEISKLLQESSLSYQKSGRLWLKTSKNLFDQHIQEVIHQNQKADQYLEEVKVLFNELKQSMDKMLVLSVSAMTMANELRELYRLKEKDPEKGKKAFSALKQKQEENDQIKREAKQLEEEVNQKLNKLAQVGGYMEKHIEAAFQAFDQVAQYFSIKRGVSDSVKQLRSVISNWIN